MKWKPEEVKSVSSIKAIGRRATAMLIIYTQGFRYTQNHRQLISFAGLSPREYSSGSSITGRPKICRKGGKPIRDVLYMCAMNAIKTNTACKALYERLRSKGKSGKLALIAVCNKLLKQVFAVVKNNTLYQPNYCSARP
jgi:transposase